MEHLGTINKINIKNSTDELNRLDIIKEKICSLFQTTDHNYPEGSMKIKRKK